MPMEMQSTESKPHYARLESKWVAGATGPCVLTTTSRRQEKIESFSAIVQLRIRIRENCTSRGRRRITGAPTARGLMNAATISPRKVLGMIKTRQELIEAPSDLRPILCY